MDYFTQPRAGNGDEINPSPGAPGSTSFTGAFTPVGRDNVSNDHSQPQTPRYPSSIRIRRLPSTPIVPQLNVEYTNDNNARGLGVQVGRRRSSSEPQRLHLSPIPHTDLTRQRTGGSYMPSVKEETSEPHPGIPRAETHTANKTERMRRVSTSARSALGLERVGSTLRPTPSHPTQEYESGVVDLLDVIGSLAPMSS